MPISRTAALAEKKRATFTSNSKPVTSDSSNAAREKQFLTIGPALPHENAGKQRKRSLSSSSIKKNIATLDAIVLRPHPDGTVHVTRTQKEKEKNADRISLDRRGLTTLPIINGEPKLRLLSLQHNLINTLEGFRTQEFSCLVFLDIYDNQLENIYCLDALENIRVLLIGKNRIKKIEGLSKLTKIEVLDLHGNQIQCISGLSSLRDLKVLNLAGNQLKLIGVGDFRGLISLQELNLRRNQLRKLLGFEETPRLQKLFVSNNEIQNVEDMSSVASATLIKEISIDNNPVSLGGDCVSFLVSYLPHLLNLNSMQVTEQVRKAANAWRRNKETSSSSFMELSSNVSLNVRREEVISNARTNWELLRSQTKCLAAKTSALVPVANPGNLKPGSDFVLTSLTKPMLRSNNSSKRAFCNIKVPILPDKKLNLMRTCSQETENSQNTSSSNTSSNEFFRLPPILVPILDKMEEKRGDPVGIRVSGSLSSIGPNIDSSVSSLLSSDGSSNENSISSDNDSDLEDEAEEKIEKTTIFTEIPKLQEICVETPSVSNVAKTAASTDSSSNLSTNTSISNVTIPSPASGSELSHSKASIRSRSIKSAANHRTVHSKVNSRASTAKNKPKQASPSQSAGRDKEQGGDYLIEICGRHLNVYGQGGLRFIDKSWSASKANDVTTVNFNYVNFNSITGVLPKIKQRFPNADHFVFKETNITNLGQLNALAEVQGLSSLVVDKEGNPVTGKCWESYAIYRLSHWGLRSINGREIGDSEIEAANFEYQSLTDLVLWSLPDVLLQPLLVRLRLDSNQSGKECSAKKWLSSADPALRNVVSKEALQWKKGTVSQDDLSLRQKAKTHVSSMLDEMCNTVNKLRLLDEQWPAILHECVRNTLLDYSQLDLYTKRKMQELK